jgi:hypothetical protein
VPQRDVTSVLRRCAGFSRAFLCRHLRKTQNFGVLYFCGAAIATVAEDPARLRTPSWSWGPLKELLAHGAEDAS